MASLVLYYGPYCKHGVIRHKIQRIRGLLKCLTDLGYEVEIVPTPYLERGRIEMKGKIVAYFNVINLLFNSECKDDCVCQKVVKFVKQAEKLMYTENNIPKHASVLKGTRFLQEVKNAKRTSNLFSNNTKLWYEIGTQPGKKSSVNTNTSTEYPS